MRIGSFGFDNLICSLGKVFESNIKITDKNEIASLIHEGWIENYIYWRDNKPYEKNKLYYKPYDSLNDERRNKCSQTKFEDLSQEEKNKDLIIAEFLINSLINSLIKNMFIILI